MIMEQCSRSQRTDEPRSAAEYEVQGAQALSTPLSLIYTDTMETNITAAPQIMNGDPSRWRPHLNTVTRHG
jgi:D-serine deaminase-like pyridoxal phosphate-dependent protein